jgi:RNA polymerase sigma-70 factor (ECF subfamily)
VRVVGNREDAEEAVQDAMLRAYRSLDRYEERGQFAAWLFRILANQCRSAATRVARRERKFPDVFHDDATPAAEPDGHPVAVAMRTDSTSDRLDAALAQLPAVQREALALRFGESLSYEDMAAITGVGVSALKMRVSRAAARLRAILLEVNCV